MGKRIVGIRQLNRFIRTNCQLGSGYPQKGDSRGASLMEKVHGQAHLMTYRYVPEDLYIWRRSSHTRSPLLLSFSRYGSAKSRRGRSKKECGDDTVGTRKALWDIGHSIRVQVRSTFMMHPRSRIMPQCMETLSGSPPIQNHSTISHTQNKTTVVCFLLC